MRVCQEMSVRSVAPMSCPGTWHPSLNCPVPKRIKSTWPLSLTFGLLRLFTDFFLLIWKPDPSFLGVRLCCSLALPQSLSLQETRRNAGLWRSEQFLPNSAYPATWPLLSARHQPGNEGTSGKKNNERKLNSVGI